ncbi:hypothetical protein CEXT_812781 [Caerostris extrusa]|uniref:Uncharacterized protein n=1 Tax=Caerostris extrusa TaxID=172846 RepID=A0AAV4NHG5_CAEEX|nr:hypothetical protein CEXT_812781 [Caerostris extrusa]
MADNKQAHLTAHQPYRQKCTLLTGQNLPLQPPVRLRAFHSLQTFFSLLKQQQYSKLSRGSCPHLYSAMTVKRSNIILPCPQT